MTAINNPTPAYKNAVAAYDRDTDTYTLTCEGCVVFAAPGADVRASLAPRLVGASPRTVVTAYVKALAADDYNPGPAARVLGAYAIE